MRERLATEWLDDRPRGQTHSGRRIPASSVFVASRVSLFSALCISTAENIHGMDDAVL